jgi:hypothetical protein
VAIAMGMHPNMATIAHTMKTATSNFSMLMLFQPSLSSRSRLSELQLGVKISAAKHHIFSVKYKANPINPKNATYTNVI